jgi:hypothetical protein
MRSLPPDIAMGRNADQERINRAFARHSGANNNVEAEEDKAYSEIQQLIGDMERIVVRLRELHKAPAEQEEHMESGSQPDEDTGSPSMQAGA